MTYDPHRLAQAIIHRDTRRDLEIYVSGRLAPGTPALLTGRRADYLYLTRIQHAEIERLTGGVDAFVLDHATKGKDYATRNRARQAWWRLLCHLAGLADWEYCLAPAYEYEDAT